MECKRQTDGRRLDKRMKEILRQRVVRQVADGARPAAVADVLDINIRTVYRWLAEYRDGGMEALKARPIPGRPPKLDESQTAELRHAVLNRTPADYGLGYGVWSLQLARELVEKRWDMHLSQVSVARLLQRFVNLRRQRPLQQAETRLPQATARWLRYVFPQAVRRAKAANAQLLFGQGTAFDALLSERTAVGGRSPREIGPQLFLALSSRGQMHFMANVGEVTPDDLCRFFNRLTEGREQPLHLVLEPGPIMEQDKVRRELAMLGDRLTPVFLPAGEAPAMHERITLAAPARPAVRNSTALLT